MSTRRSTRSAQRPSRRPGGVLASGGGEKTPSTAGRRRRVPLRTIERSEGVAAGRKEAEEEADALSGTRASTRRRALSERRPSASARPAAERSVPRSTRSSRKPLSSRMPLSLYSPGEGSGGDGGGGLELGAQHNLNDAGMDQENGGGVLARSRSEGSGVPEYDDRRGGEVAGELLSPQLLRDPVRARLLQIDEPLSRRFEDSPGDTSGDLTNATAESDKDARIAELEDYVRQLEAGSDKGSPAAGGGVARKRSRVEDGSDRDDARRVEIAQSEAGAARSEAERYRSRYEESQQRVEKLRRQLQFVTEEDEAARKAAADKELEYHRERLESSEKIRRLDQARRLLQADLEQTKDQYRDARSALQRAEASLSQVTTSHSSAVESQQAAVEELQSKLRAAEADAAEVPALRQELSNIKSTRVLPAKEAAETIKQLKHEVSSLHDKLGKAERAERRTAAEAKRLRGDMDNSLLVGERLRSAEAKAERYWKDSQTLIEVRAEQEALLAAEKDWLQALKASLGDLGSSLPELSVFDSEMAEDADRGADAHHSQVSRFIRAVVSIVDDLRRERAVVLNTSGRAESKASSASRAATDALRQVVDLQRQLQEAEEKQALAEDGSRQMERRCTYLTRERDSLKLLVESYDRQPAKAGADGGDGGTDHASSSTIAALEEAVRIKEGRIAQLESSLADAEERAGELEKRSRTLTPSAVHAKAKARVSELQQEIDDLQGEKSKLTSALEASEKQVAFLEARVGRGDFNRSTTKVLHLSMNPSKQAKNSKEKQHDNLVESLRAEIASLKSALDSAGGDRASDAGAPSAGGSAASTSAVEQDLRKKNLRLKEVFKEKISQLRNNVYLLTGFKVDMETTPSKDTKIYLRSMYAEREDDFLLLQSKGGGLELLETAYCERIDPKMFAYLTTCHSIPAFLASLTLDLFEKQTLTLQ